jgi:hypothetical protein
VELKGREARGGMERKGMMNFERRQGEIGGKRQNQRKGWGGGNWREVNVGTG